MYFEPVAGLGNRLRALGKALLLSDKPTRTNILISVQLQSENVAHVGTEITEIGLHMYRSLPGPFT